MTRDEAPASVPRQNPNGGAPQGTLTIELEDAATRKGWVGRLGLLSGTMQMWHFVALLGDKVRYESDTFSATYSWGHLPLGRTMLPRNEWAPGMDEALEVLRAEIVADGWVAAGHGDQHWQDHYRRQTGSGPPERFCSSPTVVGSRRNDPGPG